MNEVEIDLVIPLEVTRELRPGESVAPVETPDGMEWWVFDADGEFVEAYWLETDRASAKTGNKR